MEFINMNELFTSAGGGGVIRFAADLEDSDCPSSSVMIGYALTELNLVFFRAYIVAGNTYSVGTQYVACTIPEEYRPNSRWALSVYDGSSATTNAYVGSNGQVVFKPKVNDMGSSYLMYISGCWFIDG